MSLFQSGYFSATNTKKCFHRIIRLKFYGGLNTRNVVYISYIHIHTSLFAKETSVLGKEEAFQNLQSNLRESFQRHYKAKQRKLYRSN